MDDRDQPRTLAALLAQGRHIHLFSCALSLATTLFFLTAFALHATWSEIILAPPILLLGVFETWLAFRVGFDAKLFSNIAEGKRETAEELEAMDGALLRLGLMPKSKTGRPLTERRRGALRLLKWQAACAAGQCVILFGAGVARLF